MRCVNLLKFVTILFVSFLKVGKTFTSRKFSIVYQVEEKNFDHNLSQTETQMMIEKVTLNLIFKFTSNLHL